MLQKGELSLTNEPENTHCCTIFHPAAVEIRDTAVLYTHACANTRTHTHTQTADPLFPWLLFSDAPEGRETMRGSEREGLDE